MWNTQILYTKKYIPFSLLFSPSPEARLKEYTLKYQMYLFLSSWISFFGFIFEHLSVFQTGYTKQVT